MLPLENVTAFVLGTGPDLPVDRLGRLDGYFTVGVNRIWKHGIVPTVSFWIDGGIYQECPSHFDKTLCVCDISAKSMPYHVGLQPRPARRLPRHLNPNYLYHLPNTAVVAALWAVSMGCYPVVLLGCGCIDDGRLTTQLEAMRKALAAAVAMNYKPPGAHFATLWPWSGDLAEFDENLHNYYVQPCNADRLIEAVREFYGVGS